MGCVPLMPNSVIKAGQAMATATVELDRYEHGPLFSVGRCESSDASPAVSRERRQSNRAVSRHVLINNHHHHRAVQQVRVASPLHYHIPLQSVAEGRRTKAGNQSPSTTMAAVVVARERSNYTLLIATIDTISSVL
jgi:hypothetical protein